MKTRGTRILGWIAAALVLLIVVPWTVGNAVEGSRLRATLKNLAARGWPMTVAQLRAPALPDEQNAALVLNRAFLLMSGGKTESGALDPAVRELVEYRLGADQAEKDLARLDATAVASLRRKMEAGPVKEILATLHEAALRPAADFRPDYAQGPTLLIPQASQVRNAVRLLCLDAWLKAELGDGAGALAELDDALAVGWSVSNDRLLICFLVACACDNMTIDSLQSVLSRLPPARIPEESRAALNRRLAAHRAAVKTVLTGALDGERIGLGDWFFDQVLNGRMSVPEFHALVSMTGQPEAGRAAARLAETAVIWVYLHPARPLLKADYRFYLETLAAMRESVAEVPAAGAPWTPWKDPPIPRCAVMTKLILPALGSCLRKGVEWETKLDLAILGLELENAVAANGTYPAELPGGAVRTLDPFSGKAFVYRPATNSVLLYSVGPDGRDDGGVAKMNATNPGVDLVWRVERP